MAIRPLVKFYFIIKNYKSTFFILKLKDKKHFKVFTFFEYY